MISEQSLVGWSQFEVAHDFEKVVQRLTEKSIDTLASEDAFKETILRAFAFSVDALYGDIVLSVDVGVEEAPEDLGPPDWSHEVIAMSIPEIERLWKADYGQIQQKIESFMDAADDEDSEAFGNGFLDSLRRIMVRLERQNSFGKLHRSQAFRTLVTEIDADADEEERLLNEMREHCSS